MEPAKIDWENVESIFALDQVFEDINAPQWVDFLSPDASSFDDVAWFCRSDCNHPRTAEDYLRSPSSKLLRSVSVSKIIGLADWTRREATNLKRRGGGNQLTSVVNEEKSENQNPNFSTPLPNHNQIMKAEIKCSAEKVDDEYSEITLESDEKPKVLKATQSAKDLFGGREIFGKITEFCTELRKMAVATKAKEKEDQEQEGQKLNSESEPICKPLAGGGVKEKEPKRAVLGPISEKTSERRPLLEVKLDAGVKSNAKGKLMRKNKMRGEESENVPVSLDLINVKREEKVLPIRTNPPTPQGFSATRDPSKATPSKGPKSRLMERTVFEEVNHIKTLREELCEKNDTETASLVATKGGGGGGRTLDVFWFLKPCTLSS